MAIIRGTLGASRDDGILMYSLILETYSPRAEIDVTYC